VETVTLESAPGRPTGRRFGRVVHDILQHAAGPDEAESLAAIWGRRHGAGETEQAAAAEAARAALEYLERIVPAGASRSRELPVMVRLADGTIVDGRIDFTWSDGQTSVVVDYKTDRREQRNVAQVQLYGLALGKATGLAVRGIVLEV
jgi:ATP-dependent exoDNAse (exonuclease V) beta subunit